MFAHQLLERELSWLESTLINVVTPARSFLKTHVDIAARPINFLSVSHGFVKQKDVARVGLLKCYDEGGEREDRPATTKKRKQLLK